MPTTQATAGPREGIPRGQATIKLTDALTREEKASVRNQWQPCLNSEDHLCPRKIHSWLSSAVRKSFKRMAGLELFDKNLSVLFCSSCPVVTAIVTCVDDDKHKAATTLTLNMYPIMQLGGLGPSSAFLQHPLPMQLPYSRHGMRILQDVERKLDRGELNVIAVLQLVGGNDEVSQPPRSRRKSRRRQRHYHEEPKPPLYWTITFEEIETDIYKQAIHLECMEAAMETMEVVQAIKKERGENWEIVNQVIIRNVLLWVMKKAAHKLHGLADWYMTFMDTLKGVLERRCCPGFLQPKTNIIPQGSEGSACAVVAADIGILLDHLEEKRTYYYS